MVNKTSHIKTGAHQRMKSYITYDVSSRMGYVYEARVDAEDGDACLVTQYAYSGATTLIIKMIESNSTWTASWDI